MAKTLVIDSNEGTRVPFLRGILTRSLQSAGLPFEDAYKLSAKVREELASVDQIGSVELRRLVLEQLRKSYPHSIAQRYAAPVSQTPTIMVRARDDQVTPFSRAQLQRNLVSTGLTGEKAMEVTARMHQHLLKKGVKEVSAHSLGHLIHRCLQCDVGKEAARRYLVWADFLHSGRPLILLIGGTAGCGKSTIATELANRLEVVRTQSTDMLREVMRMMIPQRLMPVLHASSFLAWEALPHPEHATDREALLEDGYRTQAELLSVPCEAVVQRALRERVSMILEGVHVQPTLVDRIQADGDAVVVLMMLAVLKQEQLSLRFRGRAGHAPRRSAQRYLENFDGIWSLQSYLLSEADRTQVRILENGDKEQAVQEAMNYIVDTMAQRFDGTPETVFGGYDAL